MSYNRTSQKKNIFIIGLHRSGTSLLADLVGSHPDVSSFRETGFPEDEGQFLQSVYPPAKVYGGPGKFGFDERSHLTENSELLSRANREKLRVEWGKYWDPAKTFQLEKSPPNLLKTRFLQCIFPQTYFILIQRDPVAVSYATRKWSVSSIRSLLEHWLVCHTLFEEDRKFLNNVYSVRYEALVQNPSGVMEGIFRFIGADPAEGMRIPFHEKIRSGINDDYFSEWVEEYSNATPEAKSMYQELDEQLRKFNYSLRIG